MSQHEIRSGDVIVGKTGKCLEGDKVCSKTMEKGGKACVVHKAGSEVTKEIPCKFSFAEMTEVYELLKLSGQCYLKEHVLMILSGDKSGHIRQWHDKVTVKNLDLLIPIAHEMGFSMPWPKPLEERENQIKAKFGKEFKEAVITEGEALGELKTGGTILAMKTACAFAHAHTDKTRGLFCDLKKHVGDELIKICDALQKTDNFFPIPLVNRFTQIESGVCDRK